MRILAANVYGLTKTAAEDLCKLFHRNHGLACLVLRTSRFLPEEDERKETLQSYDDSSVKASEFLYRRVDIRRRRPRSSAPLRRHLQSALAAKS